MKKLIFIFFSFSVLFFVSCKPDSSDDPLAPAPNVDARDKYIGVWLCNETSQISGNTSYTINISKSTTSTSEILIDKFYDLQAQARASVSGSNINIPYQQLGTIGFTSGTGTLSSTGNNLSLNYTTNIAGNKDTCSANCTKQ
jgi:hypothetical protein